MNLIVVDDELLVRKGILMTIDWNKIGIDAAFEASDGEEALRLIQEKNIDIIITDIRMPRMDGLELIRRIREEGAGRSVIVLSCVEDMDAVRQALKFGGAVDYLPKLSMNLEELAGTVLRVVARYGEAAADRPVPPASFFTSEMEARLREALERGDEKEVADTMEEIWKSSGKLGEEWRHSLEWQEITGILASVIKKYAAERYPEIAESIAKLHAGQGAGMRNQFIGGLSSIAAQAKRLIDEELRKNSDPVIRAATRYIQAHYQENLYLNDVARFSGVSESYLSKLFKKNMQMSFVDYLNFIRIEQAKMLLQNRTLSIQQVSEETGFSNAGYFTQIFKSFTGITPKHYQSNN